MVFTPAKLLFFTLYAFEVKYYVLHIVKQNNIHKTLVKSSHRCAIQNKPVMLKLLNPIVT